MTLIGAPQFLCLSWLAWVACASSASAAPRNVLLLYDERLELPGLTALDAELGNTLASNSPHPIELYREEMDLSRFSSDSYKALLRGFLRAKYADKKIDVVVAVFGPALDFLLDYGGEMFPQTPIVFCGIDRKELGGRSLPPHVRGVLLKREFAPTLELALRLHPQTKRAIVVAGTSEFDKRLLGQAREELRPYEDRLDLTDMSALPMRELLNELSQLPPQTIVLFTTVFRDGAGEPFVPHEAAQRVSAAANAPVYGFLDQYLGRGIVGGNLYSTAAHGSEAAKLVMQVLADPITSAPPLVEPAVSKVMFDWRQMQRWGISPANLPAGSEIRFRDPTIWDQYRDQIILTIAAVLVQAALIGWLVFEHRRRHLAEVQSRRSMAELTVMNRRSAAGELSASIAHEVNQPLAAIATWSSAASRWLSAETPDLKEVRACLEQVATETHRAADIISSVRAMFRRDASERLPVDINKLILSVLSIVRIDLERSGVVVQLLLGDRLATVMGDKVQLQQVVLNLVMNAMEAMHLVQLRVLKVQTVQTKAGTVQVSIEDTGTGIDPSHVKRIFEPLFTTKTRGTGMGLAICCSIIESHEGRISASPGTNGGSIFRFELPADSDEPSAGLRAEGAGGRGSGPAGGAQAVEPNR